MIKVVLIDDEEHALETLEWKIKNYCPDVAILQTFSSPVKALPFLQEQQFDLLFLDIEMPEMNGFELLQQVRDVHFDVIFTTAYDEYGIKAIKYSALDYLLKPVQVEELTEAVSKFQEKHSHSVLPQQLEVLFQSLQEKNAKNQKIALSTKESIELVAPKDIIMCESDSNYTLVYLQDRKKLISKTLKDFEEMLVPFNFFRTHQSYLINVEQIAEFVKGEGGYLVMKNGLRVPVSRSKREALMKYF